MSLLVVGAGPMGRWLAETLAPDTVAFADTDPAVAEAAAASVGGEAVPTGTDCRFDVVAFAVPMGAIESAVCAHDDCPRDAVVDVTGAMAPAVAALREIPDCERLSLHPLFAPDRGTGRIAAVRDAAGPTTEAICERLRAAGNRVFETTPAEHDRAMETVQAGAHAAVLAFALAAGDVRPAFHTPVSGRLASIAKQVTEGNPDVYADIQATFDGATAVAEAADRIAAADHETFTDLFREAGENVPLSPDDEVVGDGSTTAATAETAESPSDAE